MTIPIGSGGRRAPVSTILMETYKSPATASINNAGIRVGGAHGGESSVCAKRCCSRVAKPWVAVVHRDLFPRGGHVEQATFWTGLRPMTRRTGTRRWSAAQRIKICGSTPATARCLRDHGLRLRAAYQRSDLGPHAGDPLLHDLAVARYSPRFYPGASAAMFCTAHTTKGALHGPVQ